MIALGRYIEDYSEFSSSVFRTTISVIYTTSSEKGRDHRSQIIRFDSLIFIQSHIKLTLDSKRFPSVNTHQHRADDDMLWKTYNSSRRQLPSLQERDNLRTLISGKPLVDVGCRYDRQHKLRMPHTHGEARSLFRLAEIVGPRAGLFRLVFRLVVAGGHRVVRLFLLERICVLSVVRYKKIKTETDRACHADRWIDQMDIVQISRLLNK